MEKSTTCLTEEISNIKDVREYLKENAAELQVPDCLAYLLKCAEEHGVKRSQLIRNSGLERTFCSHLLSGSKKLTRNKAIALAVGAHLSVAECQNFLKYAGLPVLYPREQRDSAIMFYLRHGVTMTELNHNLADLGLETLNDC